MKHSGTHPECWGTVIASCQEHHGNPVENSAPSPPQRGLPDPAQHEAYGLLDTLDPFPAVTGHASMKNIPVLLSWEADKLICGWYSKRPIEKKKKKPKDMYIVIVNEPTEYTVIKATAVPTSVQ